MPEKMKAATKLMVMTLDHKSGGDNLGVKTIFGRLMTNDHTGPDMTGTHFQIVGVSDDLYWLVLPTQLIVCQSRFLI